MSNVSDGLINYSIGVVAILGFRTNFLFMTQRFIILYKQNIDSS